MPARYKLSPRAEEDFTGLLYELAEHSGWTRSMAMEEKLYAAFNALAANSGLGHAREDLWPQPVRFYYVEPYMVLYLHGTTPLYVIAILHGSRDLASIMRTRGEI
jgi:plasmid stabilization system protein ParE